MRYVVGIVVYVYPIRILIFGFANTNDWRPVWFMVVWFRFVEGVFLSLFVFANQNRLLLICKDKSDLLILAVSRRHFSCGAYFRFVCVLPASWWIPKAVFRGAKLP